MTDDEEFSESKDRLVQLRCTRGCCFISPEWDDDVEANGRGHSSPRSAVEVQGFRVARNGGRHHGRAVQR